MNVSGRQTVNGNIKYIANYGLNRQTYAGKHLSQQALVGIALLPGLSTVNICQAVLLVIIMKRLIAGRSRHCRPSVWQNLSLRQATRHLLL